MLLSIHTKGHRWETMMNQLSAGLGSVVCLLSWVATCSSQQKKAEKSISEETPMQPQGNPMRKLWKQGYTFTYSCCRVVPLTRTFLPHYFFVLSVSIYYVPFLAAQCATPKKRHKKRLYRFSPRILRLAEIVWYLKTIQGTTSIVKHSRRLAELLITEAKICLPPCSFPS